MDGYSRTARVPSQYGQPSPFVTRARIGASTDARSGTAI